MAEPKTSAESPAKGIAARQSSSAEVNAFIEKVRAVTPAASGRGRLIFAMDATMSRQPTWDLACSLQARMFEVTSRTSESGGGLAVQLVYFRGILQLLENPQESVKSAPRYTERARSEAAMA